LEEIAMIRLFRYVPGWSVPCISPYVSKVATYLRMTGHDFELVAQDLSRLREDAPRGKLPYIVAADGTIVPDSTEIIVYLKERYGDPLDQNAAKEEGAQMVAWNRMVDEHTYWCGVIQPRWRMDEGWETYVPILAQTNQVPEAVRTFLDELRVHIKNEFVMQGMGLKNDKEVLRAFEMDSDALSDFLGEKDFFMGAQPRSIDASVFSILIHTIEAPFEWPGKAHIASKVNLVDYMARMRGRFDLSF
jgi:glutathione S-transferase